jgi:hypothetical protein
VVIIVLGIFGIIITEKYYERFRHHVCRIGRIMEKLEELYPVANINELEKRADDKH